MKKKVLFVSINMMIKFLLLLLLALPMLWASPPTTGPGEQIFYPYRVSVKPKIDGVLEEKAWQQPPLEKDFITYNPLYGERLPHKTRVWMAYDSNNLYFAFKCYDPDPQKIKTSITRRDDMYRDDWIGLSLDAQANKQSSYHFFVNPNGIQGDALNSSVTGEDTSPDFVWKSGGKIVEDGYQVEICIPLRSISFRIGKEVKMGILFWRNVNRLGISAAWPEIKPGQWVFNSHALVIYKGLKNPLKLELLPSITYSNNRERISQQEFIIDGFTDLSIGLKYGITSSITADITVNPDFSQVESDAFQVEVNQRYPLFYNEKRPFFMEGAGIFNFFTVPFGFISNAVHTRQIVNPLWGAKLTGTLGKTSFGILSAGDEWPGQAWEGEINPDEGKSAFFGIARAKYSLGKDNYIGALYSGREFAGEYNRVVGADIGYRLSKSQRVNTSYLYSMSGDNDQNDNSNSSDFNLLYSYTTRKLQFQGAFEHIGKEFRMDSAHLRRIGINQAYTWLRYNIHPNPKKIKWLKQITPEVLFTYLYDLYTKMEDTYLNLALNFDFIKQGYLALNFLGIKESWENQTFNLKQYEVAGSVQLFKWLRFGGYINWGEGIYYVASPSYRGKKLEGSFFVVLQPNKKINQHFSIFHADLSKNKEELYDVNILYSRTTYQFNKYFFLRAVVQYNSYQKRMLTDFLASFTLIPGTVLHVGYGGLYENRKWQDDQWLYRQGDLVNIRRSFFFKASYLWRF